MPRLDKVSRAFHTAAGTLKEMTASVISAPRRIKSARAVIQSGADAATIKRARAYDRSNSIDAIKARTASDIAKERTMKRNRKMY